MASATYPEDSQPPPYGYANQENIKATYPDQNPAYAASPNLGASPSPAPFYVQSPLNPMNGTPFLGHNPTSIQCPRCQQQVITTVQYETGTGTWLLALGIFIFGGAFGCCLIPFCIPACQDAIHTCPACRNTIGRRNLI